MLLNLTHIGQIALPVVDVDRSETFYKDVLGLPKLFRFGDLTFFDCAGVRLLLEKSKEAFKPQGCIYFRCADIALTVAELTRRGIAFKHQPHLIAKMDDHDLWMAFFTDPDGHMLAVMHEAPKGYAPSPLSRNRRGRIDDQDRFWFAEYRGNKIAMLDTKEERIQEWPLPTKFTQPYDVIWDKNGQLWTGGMTSDRVVRLDPKSGEAVEYPLPRDTNMRRMFVDNSTTPPTFWVGSNHGASIVRVEPLD